MKRILTTVLLCVFAIIASQSQTFLVDNILYQITSSVEPLTVEVIGSIQNEGDIVIPTSVEYNGNTYSVTRIGYNAFNGRTGLTSVTIPNTVTSIGDYAFRNCTGLTSIVIPNMVTSIGNFAFLDCTGLTSIVIPNLVITIGNAAFRNCTGLTGVVIGNSVTTIGGLAFDNCKGLTSIVIPNSVTSIGNAAFRNCTGLTAVVIGNSVTSIGDYAFRNCTELTSIYVAGDNTIFASIDGVLYNKDITTLITCPEGKKNVSIPSSVTSIGDNAFYGCAGLTSINIPNSVTSIGNGVFSGCTGLTSIEVASDNAFFASIDGVLYNKEITTLITCPAGKTNVLIPSSVTSIGNDAFRNCTVLTSIVIPNSVTSIGYQAFQNCKGLTSIEIPSLVTSIGNGVFSGCTGLIYIEIPSLVTSIGNGTFQGCEGLTSIIIPSSVTSIGNAAFSNCTGLTSIVIPSLVTSIGGGAFYGCTGLIYIECHAISPPSLGVDVFFDVPKTIPLYVPEESISAYQAATQWNDFLDIRPLINIPSEGFRVDNIQYRITSNVEPLTVEVISKTPLYEGDIVIPSNIEYNGNNYSVKRIGESAFSDCIGLTSIEIPSSLSSIGDYAFIGCKGLTSIVIPNSVTSIGDYAFLVCTELTSIDVASDNNYYTSIDGVLYNKDITTLITCPAGKTNVSIPSSVSSIGDNAFYACRRLTSIEIPNSVIRIGDYAFAGCTLLTTIEISISATTIGDWAFTECIGLTSIEIPSSVTSIGKGAFYYCTGLTSVHLGNSVITLGCWAFEGCAGLTSIEIPSSVTSIGEGAFVHCTSLTSINVASDNSYYSSIDGVLFNKDLTTLITCPAGRTSVSIPSSVTTIGFAAFATCTGLTSINIPNSVTSIGDYAFFECTGLTYIECQAISPPSLGEDVFEDVPKTIPLFVPEGSISAYQAASQWNDFLDIRPLVSLSTEPKNSLELVVYPNPVMDMLSIKGVEENTMVKIYDIKGHLLFSIGNCQENQSIDVSFLPSGIYVVKVVQNGRSSFARVLKE